MEQNKQDAVKREDYATAGQIKTLQQSFMDQIKQLEQLEQSKQDAVKKEDYVAAAKPRQQQDELIKNFQGIFCTGLMLMFGLGTEVKLTTISPTLDGPKDSPTSVSYATAAIKRPSATGFVVNADRYKQGVDFPQDKLAELIAVKESININFLYLYT